MADVMQKTFDVEVKGKKFTFRIPTITHDIAVGYKAADVRRRAYPAGNGSLGDADQQAFLFSRYVAYMELYLESAEVTWPFSKGPDEKPVVDFMKFGHENMDQVYAVGEAFDEAYGRFRTTGNFDKRPAGEETVAG